MIPHPTQPLSEGDLSMLRQVFRRHPGVRAVYLFGSHATGRVHPGSDLDLAVLPADPSVRGLKLVLLTELARAGFDEVSLVFLDTTDLVLKYEAVRHNRLVYAKEDFDRGAYYSRVVREYLDFEPCLRVQREAYKRRILHGAAGGSAQEAEQAR